MSIPVVIISKSLGGSHSELPLVVDQAKKYNQEVFLIGDEGNAHCCPDNHESMFNYYEDVEKFESLYTHLSTNPFGIEQFCFSRWFILRNFLRKNNYEGAFYMDNDILLFVDVSEEYKKVKHLYCTLSGRTSGHASYWSLKGIESFCDYLLEVYSNKSSYEFDRLSSHYSLRKKHGLTGGLCDMTLLEHFARYRCPHLVGESSIADPTGSEPYYDHVIQQDEGFEFENNRKVFIIKEGKPYSKHMATGVYLPFATVHFQGSNKPLMAPFIKKCNDSLI